MPGSNEDRVRSRRLGAQHRGWLSIGRVLGDQTIETSGATVCGLYHAQVDEEHEFLGVATEGPKKMTKGEVNGSQSKFLIRNSTYIPNRTQYASLLIRSRVHRYRKTTSSQNRVRTLETTLETKQWFKQSRAKIR
jgi:hypothetical protein